MTNLSTPIDVLFALSACMILFCWFKVLTHSTQASKQVAEGRKSPVQGQRQPTRNAREPIVLLPTQPVAPIFPSLPRTESELRAALQHARGVQRDRLIQRLTELEEEGYRGVDDLLMADDDQILEDL